MGLAPAQCLILTSSSTSTSSTSILTARQSIPRNSHFQYHDTLSECQDHRRRHVVQISRRDAVSLSILTLLPSLSHPDAASAFEFGISGPKDWLKEQKKKSAKFLLAPVDATRQILNSAYLLLMSKESDYTEKDVEEFQNLLKSAARDCVPQDRNSFVVFQANTGVEVCTFRLIVKNASSLLDDKAPVKLEAEAILSDLVRSFSCLNGLAADTEVQLSSKRKKVADAIMDTISSLNKFEQGIKNCLEA